MRGRYEGNLTLIDGFKKGLLDFGTRPNHLYIAVVIVS